MIYARKVLCIEIDSTQSHEKPRNAIWAIRTYLNIQKRTFVECLLILIHLYNPLFEAALTSREIRYAFKLVTEHWLQTVFHLIFIFRLRSNLAYAHIACIGWICRNNWAATVAAAAAITVTSARFVLSMCLIF